MTIKETIKEDIKLAIKSGDTFTRDILRLIKNEIEKVEKENLAELNDSDTIQVIDKYRKTVQEQINDAKKVNRLERLSDFENQLTIAMKYLPKQLTEDEVRQLTQQVITQHGFEKKDFGKVMQNMSQKTKGIFDGKKLNKIVTEILG